jgi:hypothetical protein
VINANQIQAFIALHEKCSASQHFLGMPDGQQISTYVGVKDGSLVILSAIE